MKQKSLSFQTKRRLVKLRRLGRWWPWLASGAVHIVILGVLSIVVFVSYNTKAQRPEIVPEARLGKVYPGLPLFQKIKQDIDLPQETNFEKNLRRQLSPQDPTLAAARRPAGGSKEKLPFSPIGIRSPGTGDGILSGTRLSGSSPVGLPGSDLAKLQPSAPETKFFASGGNAYNIVYLVDRSASMTDSIEPLKRELKRSIGELQPMQKFHVIFFSAGKPEEGPAGDLTWATDRNKERYYQFLGSIQAQGQTDPQWALQRALQLNPDLIYLLTDGIFPEKMAEKMIEWAKLHKVKINTIAYVLESGGSLLRKIAEQTGGIYKFVSEEQLQ
jgi:hypothetical protein